MSDYRIEAASREEWAERALRAEAERDDAWNDALEAATKAVGVLIGRDVQKRDAEDVGEAYDMAIWEALSALRAMKKGPTSAENVQLSSAD